MPPLDLDDAEKAALVELLRDTIEGGRFPRVKLLRAILAKLEPPKPAVEAMPPPKPRPISRRRGRRYAETYAPKTSPQ